MFRNAPSPKAGLSVALGAFGAFGMLLASFACPAVAAGERFAEASAPQRFELIPDGRASELPAELRAREIAPSISEAL
ncbi:MAG: hypothetical protein ABIV06_12835, partial [Thermoanaerobaculia bacterium]